ncbi:origin recognition complex subunit 4 [Asimina triloba]
MLRECGLAHKTIIFALEEFDLFTQGKQRLLYSLLDALQSLTSQAVVIGVSCRLDADQLLEKRVRSRFSHRKLLFVPPSTKDIQRLLDHIFSLPTDLDFSSSYATEFNEKIQHGVINASHRSVPDTDGHTGTLISFFRAQMGHAVGIANEGKLTMSWLP